MFSYFLKAAHLSSFVFKADSNNRCIIYTLTHILYNKYIVYVSTVDVFSTVDVSLGFALGNIGSLGSTKHTVSLGLSQ